MPARLCCRTTPAFCVTFTVQAEETVRSQHKTLSPFSNLSCSIPIQPFYIWCKMLLIGLHNFILVSITLFLPSNSSIFPLPLPPLLSLLKCTRVRGNHNNNIGHSFSSFISKKIITLLGNKYNIFKIIDYKIASPQIVEGNSYFRFMYRSARFFQSNFTFIVVRLLKQIQETAASYYRLQPPPA